MWAFGVECEWACVCIPVCRRPVSCWRAPGHSKCWIKLLLTRWESWWSPSPTPAAVGSCNEPMDGTCFLSLPFFLCLSNIFLKKWDYLIYAHLIHPTFQHRSLFITTLIPPAPIMMIAHILIFHYVCILPLAVTHCISLWALGESFSLRKCVLNVLCQSLHP